MLTLASLFPPCFIVYTLDTVVHQTLCGMLYAWLILVTIVSILFPTEDSVFTFIANYIKRIYGLSIYSAQNDN